MRKKQLRSWSGLQKWWQKKGTKTPQTIVFCSTFNDISTVLSYLLLVLKEKAFITDNGKRASLLRVYHAKSWEFQKVAIEADFKSNGMKSVVIGTCALWTGINFPKVKYVVQYGPPTSTIELMQQAGRGGRDGSQAHCLTYFTNRQLARCDKNIKSPHRVTSVTLWLVCHQAIYPAPIADNSVRVMLIMKSVQGSQKFSCLPRLLNENCPFPFKQ